MNTHADKTVVFIDGPNLYATAKALGTAVDFKKWLAEFKDVTRWGDVLRHVYFTAVPGTDEYNSIKPLIDWLVYNGFTLVTKPTKSFTDEETGRRKVKGNMDVELTVEAMEMAKSGHMSDAVLVTGDGDFTALVLALKRMGIHVTVISTLKVSPPMIADELRRAADIFIDLSDMLDSVGMSEGDRRTPRTPRNPGE